MSIVSWKVNGKETKTHIQDGYQTRCGLEIPTQGKEWHFYGEPTCKRCLKSQKAQQKNQS